MTLYRAFFVALVFTALSAPFVQLYATDSDLIELGTTDVLASLSAAPYDSLDQDRFLSLTSPHPGDEIVGFGTSPLVGSYESAADALELDQVSETTDSHSDATRTASLSGYSNVPGDYSLGFYLVLLSLVAVLLRGHKCVTMI